MSYKGKPSAAVKHFLLMKCYTEWKQNHFVDQILFLTKPLHD